MIKPIFNLTPEELEIEAAFESGEIVSRPVTDAEREEWAAMARYTLEKQEQLTSDSLKRIL